MDIVDYRTHRASQGVVATFADGWLLALDGPDEVAMLHRSRLASGWEVTGRYGNGLRRYEVEDPKVALAAWLHGEPGAPVLRER